MENSSADDLLSLSRDIRRGWTALVEWRAALAIDPSGHADDDPLEPVRRAAGKSTWEALAALTPSAVDTPLRDALRCWVFALTLARIGRPDEVSWARLAAESRGLLAGEKPGRVSWRQAWRGLVEARTLAQAELWLEAAAQAAPALAEAARTGAGRRVEVARRLGVEHAWDVVIPGARGALRQAATSLLDRTDDLARAIWKEALGSTSGPAAVIHLAMGRDAGEGWPAQLTGRWLEHAFRPGPRGVTLDGLTLPAALGAASFARALYAFGFAIRVAGAPASMPFALAHSPAFVGAHRFGFLFAALGADAEWQGRVLGVSRRIAAAQARALARTALLDARLHAARLLLGDDAAPAPGDVFEELGVRLFGAGLDRRLCGAWPSARRDEPSRFAGLLESRPLAQDLREHFDSDWYRNPRAWVHLQDASAATAHEPVDAGRLDAQVDGVARVLEVALG